jgi:hypothetical protein
MSDVTTRMARSQLINVREDYELRYWSKTFDVPKEEIEAAVKRVGTRVEDVARELSRRKRRRNNRDRSRPAMV